MSLVGRSDRHLMPITGGLAVGPDRFIRESTADIKAMSDVFLGALIETEVEKIADQHCGGIEHMKPAERRYWREEAREHWIKRAAGVVGNPARRERLQAIGRGEDVEDQ